MERGRQTASDPDGHCRPHPGSSWPRPRNININREKAELEERDKPDFDAGLEALIPVLAGRVPAHFHAHRADDIATAVRLSRELGLDLTIVHGTEGQLIADFLAKEGVPVITWSFLTDRSKPELRGWPWRTRRRWLRRGCGWLSAPTTRRPLSNTCPSCAALAARAGMDEEEALAAITINAACMAGADDGGFLTIGKRCRCGGYVRPPFDVKSRVQYVGGSTARRCRCERSDVPAVVRRSPGSCASRPTPFCP